MRKICALLTISFSLSFLFSASSAFAQAEKWKRDMFEILADIEDRQKEILSRLEDMNQDYDQILADLEKIKKRQKSYVNPKWAP